MASTWGSDTALFLLVLAAADGTAIKQRAIARKARDSLWFSFTAVRIWKWGTRDFTQPPPGSQVTKWTAAKGRSGTLHLTAQNNDRRSLPVVRYGVPR